MAFKTVISLDADTTTAIGGTAKKNGKLVNNPTSAEGYYLGHKMVPSKKSKTGEAALHVFQTSKGNLGVWGKTDLDRKLRSVQVGTMTRVTFTGMKETENNPMYVYKVESDADNVIDVSALEANEGIIGTDGAFNSEAGDYEEGLEAEEETPIDEEEAPLDETPPARAQAPKKAAVAPSAASRAATLEKLKARSNTKVA